MKRKSAVSLVISGITLAILGVNFYLNLLPLIGVAALVVVTGLLISATGMIELMG